MYNLFNVPNLDKNVKLEELPNGIRLVYVLSCDKNYPKRVFYSKGKWYTKSYIDVNYSNKMGDQLNKAYLIIKNTVMLELALFKRQEILNKITILQNNLSNIK
jgi:hypothetical protein